MTTACVLVVIVVVHELVNVLDEIQVPAVGCIDSVLRVHSDCLLVEGVQMRLGGRVSGRPESPERRNAGAPHRRSAEEDARATAVAPPEDAHARLHSRRPRTVTPARFRERRTTMTVPVASFVVAEVLHNRLELLLDLVFIARHGCEG